MTSLLLQSLLIIAVWFVLLFIYRVLMKLAGIVGAIGKSRELEVSWPIMQMFLLLVCLAIVIAEIYLPIRLVLLIVRYVRG